MPRRMGRGSPACWREVGPALLGEASGHDLAHCLRVRNLALRIAAAEGGDGEALAGAAYLHDLFRDDPANADKGRAAAFAAEALARAGFPAAREPVVRACILYHSWSGRVRGGAGRPAAGGLRLSRRRPPGCARRVGHRADVRLWRREGALLRLRHAYGRLGAL